MNDTRPALRAAIGPDAADARPFVLCIDDDSIWEPMLTEVARRLGARVVFVEDPELFKRLAKEQSPAGVIVDQIMPDSTGAELIMWLRCLGSPPWVLNVSSNPLYLETAEILVRGAGLTSAGSLLKPLTLRTLTAALAPMLPQNPGQTRV